MQPVPNNSRSPVVVSFHCGGSYYDEAARRLREDCARAGLEHDIVELQKNPQDTWIDVCRRKVPFFLRMHLKHRRPILWLDVDSRLAARPGILDGATCDFAAFLRGFRYLRGFDPLSVPRFFAPFALYFNASPRVTSFLELMAKLEAEHSGAATDDYFLQEAWQRHDQQLAVMVMPPDLVGHEWPLGGNQIIYVGISGNASKFKAAAQQHVAETLAPPRRKAVLLHEAESARRDGYVDDALLLYKRALALTPDDEALASKISRLTPSRISWRRWLTLGRSR
jgi:hypothetical protein